MERCGRQGWEIKLREFPRGLCEGKRGVNQGGQKEKWKKKTHSRAIKEIRGMKERERKDSGSFSLLQPRDQPLLRLKNLGQLTFQ